MVRKMQKKQEMRRSSHSYFEQVQQHRSLAQVNALNSQTAYDSTQFPFFAGREYASQRLKAQQGTRKKHDRIFLKKKDNTNTSRLQNFNWHHS